MRCPFVGIELGDKLEELGMCLFLTLLWNVSMYEVGPIEDELLCAHLRRQQTATRSQFRFIYIFLRLPFQCYWEASCILFSFPSSVSCSSFPFLSLLILLLFLLLPSFFLPFQVHINSLNILFTCDHKYQELGVGS